MTKTTTMIRRHRKAARIGSRSQRGMTLIEIMVVLVILGMIMGAVGYNVMGQMRDANIRTAGLDVKAIANAVEMYQIKNSGRLPDSLETLVPNEIREIRKDPWGNTYVYVKQGDSFEVLSYGPDKSQGGGDDITSNSSASAQR